jgi:diguanylate cyclase (GGDEF)-like protein
LILPFHRPFIIDINHFKSVNDGFCHRRGDQILAEFGRRVLEVSRDKDLIFRYGGDEFTGILHSADFTEAVRFSRHLIVRVGGTEFRGNPPLSITLSIALTAPERVVSSTQLLCSCH